MANRLQITTFAGIAVTVATVAQCLQGQPISSTWAASLGVTGTIMTLLVHLFDKWAWRIPLLQGWFVHRPHLWGHWKATLASEWRDDNKEQIPLIQATVEIRQTHSRLFLHLETEESQGDLICSQVIEREDGSFQLAGVFRNEPRIELKSQSRPHIGAILIDIVGDPNAPRELRGQYWTDRGTFGAFGAVRRTVH